MDHSFQPPKIAVVGSANADLIMTCPTLPGRGQTLAATEARWEAGGKGANQAVAAARLGASVAFIGCIGADALGERVRAGLAAEGIAIAGVRVAPEQPTGVAVVVVDAAGENLIVLAAGANAALGAPDVERAAAQLRHADIVLCQLETPPGGAHHCTITCWRCRNGKCHSTDVDQRAIATPPDGRTSGQTLQKLFATRALPAASHARKSGCSTACLV